MIVLFMECVCILLVELTDAAVRFTVFNRILVDTVDQYFGCGLTDHQWNDMC